METSTAEAKRLGLTSGGRVRLAIDASGIHIMPLKAAMQAAAERLPSTSGD